MLGPRRLFERGEFEAWSSLGRSLPEEVTLFCAQWPNM